MKKNSLLTGICALAMILSGCGGGGSDNTPTNPDDKPNEGGEVVEKTYTVTWKNYDDTVLETDREVKEGTDPSYDGTTPTRDSDAEFTYTFSGWSPSLSPVNADITYTAQYSKTTNGYTVTWKNYDGEVLEVDTDVKYGSMPSFDGKDPTKPSDSTYDYTFTGWTPEISVVHGDQEYTATFKGEKITYTFDFNLNGGTSSSYKGPIVVESLDAKDFFFDCQKTGWNFRGWSYNDTKVFNEKGVLINEPTLARNMTFTAIYSQTAFLNIVKNIDEAGTVTGSGEYPYYENVDVSAETNDGYIFVGWYYEETQLSANKDYRYTMWESDVTLEARFMHDFHSLHIESNNSKNGLVSLLSGTTPTNNVQQYETYVEATTTVKVSAYTLTDVRYLGWYNQNNERLTSSAFYEFTMPDEDVNLTAKWNYFTVEYVLNEGENDESNPTEYTLESTDLVLKDPTRLGYDFLGWTLDDGDDETDDIKVTSINPNWMENITLVANWKLGESKITYHLDGGTNNPNNPDTYNLFSETITLLDPTKRGYEFVAWYTDAEFNDPIVEIEQGSSGDIDVYARWLINTYIITYVLDGGTNNSSNEHEFTVESDFTLYNAYKTGYDFVGWYDNDGNRITHIYDMVGNLTLTARWSAKKYDLTVITDGNNRGTAEIITGEGYYQESVTIKATANNGCMFRGWFVDSKCVSDKETYSFTMPAKNCTYVAVFFSEQDTTNILKGVTPYLSFDNKTITFGYYPQKHVTNSQLISNVISANNRNEQGWYLYKGTYYTEISTAYYGTFSDGTSFVKDQVCMFECQPIVWDVIGYDVSTISYKVLSRDILDVRLFYGSDSDRTIDGSTVYPNNYQRSYIRSWLHDDFLVQALYSDYNHVKRGYVANDKSTCNNSNYICDNTNDFVFLPSYQEISSLGDKKVTNNSDYVLALMNNPETTGPYFTRSPSTSTKTVYYVDGTGSLTSILTTYQLGIRPAIWLKNVQTVDF